MMLPNLIFGVTGMVLFLIAVYFNYVILIRMKEKSKIIASMFFLKDSTSRTFMVVSVMVVTVAIGKILLAIENYYESYMIFISGKISLLISMFAVVYFFRNISVVAETPSKEKRFKK